MIRGLALFVLALALLAGCGGDDDANGNGSETVVAVYFLRDGQVWPVARSVEGGDTRALLTQALGQLALGPSDEEEEELDLSSAVRVEPSEMTIQDIGEGFDCPDGSDEALAQCVYTVTQFPGIESARVEGETYTRGDFEEQTPPVLVESPLSFEEVSSPIRATGTANTFEANFQYEVVDAGGEILTESFVTATSGTGTRGTFDFTTADFDVPSDGEVSLVVFELSAEDGSRMNEVEIPLRVTQG